MWGYYAALMIGFILGFFVCAIFTAARDADDEMERFWREKDLTWPPENENLDFKE